MADLDRAVASSCAWCGVALPSGAAFCPECGLPVAEPGPPRPSLPGFEILREIGAGGAARVYLARQQSLDRIVAVKVLRQDIQDDAEWRAFNREAQTLARLSGHPNVVTVYTAGKTESGHPYLVTEYMDGGSLEDAIAAQGALPAYKVASIGLGVADALMAAHALGIHHRDVKPGNVLLSGNGAVKLADFGIARLLSGRSVATTDVFAFTPEHVAPEMLRHEPDGPWSDLYGLASTLATALLGHPPIRRLPEERMDAFLARKLLAPAPNLSGVAPELAVPIGRALDPDPEQRPTVSEFRQQMAAAKAGRNLPEIARSANRDTVAATASAALERIPEPPLPPSGRPRTSHRMALATTLVFGTLLAVIVAVVISGRGDADQSTTEGPTPTSALGPVTSSSMTSTVPGSAPASAFPAPATGGVPTAPPTPVASTEPEPPTTVGSASSAPPTIPPTTPPTTLPTVGGLSQAEAEGILRDYYAAVEAGDYETTWRQLSPEFQRGKARSFQYYTSFWDENDIEVGRIELVEATARQAIIDADLRWNGSDSWQTERFTLQSDGDAWLIAEQTTLSR